MRGKFAKRRARAHRVEMPLDSVWGMEPGAFRRIRESMAALPENALEAFQRRVPPDDEDPGYEVVGGSPAGALGQAATPGVALIRFEGIVSKRMSFWGWLFGGSASCEDTQEALQNAIADPNVKSVLLIVDSPGGTVAGVSELATAMRAARALKPVNVFASDCMCSAAYWVGAQGTKVYANATAMLGSIGVYCLNLDVSRLYKNEGIEADVIASAPAKGAGAWGTQMTEAQRADIQNEVDTVAAAFTADVASGRGLDLARAQAASDGRCYLPADAQRLGLIDGVTTLADLLGMMQAEEPIVPEGVAVQLEPEDDDAEDMDDDGKAARVRTIPPITAVTPPNEPRAVEVALAEAPKEAPMSDKTNPTPAQDPPAAPDFGALKAQLDAQAKELAELKAAHAGTSTNVAEIARDREVSKLLADARGENGGPVKIGAADKITADYVALVHQTSGAEAARKLVDSLPVLGRGANGSHVRGTAQAPAGAQPSTGRLKVDFVGAAPEAYLASGMPTHEAAIDFLRINGMPNHPVVSAYRDAVLATTRRTAEAA